MIFDRYLTDIGACKQEALTSSTASLGVIGSSMKYLVRTISGPSLGASVGNISCSSELGSTSLRIGFADNGRPAECQLPLAIAFSFIYNARGPDLASSHYGQAQHRVASSHPDMIACAKQKSSAHS